MKTLLAVDLGVKTGYALFDEQGKLKRYQSHNFGNAQRLKKGVYAILKSCENLQYLYLEGGGKLEKFWIKQAEKQNITVVQLHAHDWRNKVYPAARQDHKTKASKIFAEKKALEIIKQQSLPTPSSLTHDVAEAILIGMYGCMEQQWIDTSLPL